MDATGATDHAISKAGLLIFETLPSLAPGKTALFRVMVRSDKAGNYRFRAHLSSESIKEPLIYEELTKFYAD